MAVKLGTPESWRRGMQISMGVGPSQAKGDYFQHGLADGR